MLKKYLYFTILTSQYLYHLLFYGQVVPKMSPLPDQAAVEPEVPTNRVLTPKTLKEPGCLPLVHHRLALQPTPTLAC